MANVKKCSRSKTLTENAMQVERWGWKNVGNVDQGKKISKQEKRWVKSGDSWSYDSFECKLQLLVQQFDTYKKKPVNYWNELEKCAFIAAQDRGSKAWCFTMQNHKGYEQLLQHRDASFILGLSYRARSWWPEYMLQDKKSTPQHLRIIYGTSSLG